MSMLSAQVDELRQMAESVGLAMPQAATLMMEAADTIWELRCKCAGMVDMRERARLAETENAKLREERDNYKALWEHATVTDCELRRVRAAWKEDREQNAKLRELCKAWRELAYEIFDECFGEPELNEDFMTLDDRMEALGIEVE